ncbi:MAG: DUF2177 family protein [Candidatus Babeliales bacterium]|jgi:uncharacterized membrane protein
MSYVFLLKLYFLSLFFLSLIDVPWIVFFAKNFYLEQIGHLMALQVSYLPAVLFYLMYPVALIFFVVLDAKNYQLSLTQTFLRGAFLGFTAYAAYDLTNQATLKDWPWIMTFVDVAWGSFLSGAVSTLVLYLSYYL